MSDNTIGSRIDAICAHFQINLAIFAKKVELSQSVVTQIRKGTNPLTPRTSQMIQLIFGVDKDWLENGKGEMFSVSTHITHINGINRQRDESQEFEKIIDVVKKMYYTAPREDRNYYENELRKLTVDFAHYKYGESIRIQKTKLPPTHNEHQKEESRDVQTERRLPKA